MAARSSFQQIKQQTETEIAVLQVQYGNLNEKVDELKTGLKEVSDSVEKHTTVTMQAIKELSESSKTSNKTLEQKISDLEKWRWMIMGGVALAGALGFHVIGKFLHI